MGADFRRLDGTPVSQLPAMGWLQQALRWANSCSWAAAPDLDGEELSHNGLRAYQDDDLALVRPELAVVGGAGGVNCGWLSHGIRQLEPHTHCDVMHAGQHIATVVSYGDGHCSARREAALDTVCMGKVISQERRHVQPVSSCSLHSNMCWMKNVSPACTRTGVLRSTAHHGLAEGAVLEEVLTKVSLAKAADKTVEAWKGLVPAKLRAEG